MVDSFEEVNAVDKVNSKGFLVEAFIRVEDFHTYCRNKGNIPVFDFKCEFRQVGDYTVKILAKSDSFYTRGDSAWVALK